MYHPAVVDARIEALLRQPTIGPQYPHGLPLLTIAETQQRTAALLRDYDPDAQLLTRPMTPEESVFAAVSRLRIMADAIYFLRAFVYIDEEGHGLRPLYPLWPSQQFVLDRLAALEHHQWRTRAVDGLLLNILKVRQVGISTLGMALVAHRILTQPYIRAIAGSDVEEQARYLFRMVERIYDQLPFFLKPEKIVPYAAGRELNLENKSSIKTAWGKTTRGALQAEGGVKGNLERGRTNSVVHISELATWDNPSQLDSALLPGIPIAPASLVLFESTAELAGDWWHRHWQATAEGNGRFHNLFLAWPVKYQLPAPVDWAPNDETLTVAAQITRDSHQWVGETLPLTRDHLYWYETTRAYYASKNQLLQFFKEYPSNPEECTGAETRIASNRGLIRIADAQDVTAVETGQAEQWIDRGVRDVVRLRTTYGRELICTPWHLVARSDQQTFVPVVHLAVGDELALSPPQFLAAAPYVAQWSWTPCCTMSVTVDEDLARLLGFFIGDGSWVDGGIDIACFADDADVIAEVTRLIEKHVGRPPTYKKSSTRGINVRSPIRRWFPIFWHLGLLERRADGGYRKHLRVPECIWCSPRSVVAAFLSGLFESDGFTASRYAYTSLFSKSEILIRDVQLLLLGFGINAAYQTCVKTTKGKQFTGRYLKLNKLNTEIFHRDIGFVSVRKRGCAVQQQKRQGRKAIPLHMTDRVASIEPIGQQPVYDIGVQETHRFGANGLLVHNCFQYAGRSVFTWEEIAAIDAAARPIRDVWEVRPARDIAELKRLPPESPEQVAQAAADRRRYPPPLTTAVPTRVAEQQPVPPGYGFRRLTKAEVDTLPSLRHTVFTIYEYPRTRGRHRYVIGVDVGDGLQQDYSVATVVRAPTLEEPAEEVAQFISNTIKPSELAFVVDAIGHFYPDEDGVEACVAVELNNHGITVQDLLQLHLGYSHFYVWEVVDAADPSARYTKRIGWQTTTRTRPILLEKFHDAVTTVDPISGLADFRLNSPITRNELRFFVTEGLLGEAEHAKGQHDDAIFGSAIGYYVAYRLSGGESEPIAERRRRRALLLTQQQASGGPRLDWRNSAATADAAHEGMDDDGDDELALHTDDGGVFFDERSTGDTAD